jgi:arylsulfatase A-like enzyme
MRRLALLVVLAIAAGGWWWWRTPYRLPKRMALETVVDDLSGRFVPTPPVRTAGILPRPQMYPGAFRHAILTPPPTALRFRVRALPDTNLHFAVTVRREDGEAEGPVRFIVEADGRPIFTRTVDATRKRHRRWFDEVVALRSDPARDVELVLRTEAPDGPPAGTPGWAAVRLISQRHVDRQPARPDAPSLIVLLVDTLRADRLGCYGASPSPTPALDALARRGRVFDVAIAQSSWTMPSAASILTGLNPRSHGVNGSSRDPSAAVDRLWLADGLTTLAEHAQASGITTVAVSTNPLVGAATNFTQGFETFVELPRDERGRNWAPAGTVNETFLAWLRANRAHRFLAYLHYLEPHDPYTPRARPAPPPGAPPEVVDGHISALAMAVNDGKRPPLPPEQVAYLRALYDGEIREWDEGLAHLLAGIEALGMTDQLRILVVADHGEQFQEHGQLKHGVDVYDETLRVPLIMAGPGVTPARIAAPAEGIDVFPTACALLDLPVPGALTGINLLGDPPADRTIVSELRQGDPGEQIALRAGHWKLIHTPATRRSELYDLVADPGERTNQWDAAAEGSALLARLHAWVAAAPPPPARAPEAATEPAVRDRLRALGYAD